MRGVTSALLGLVLLFAGSAASAELPGGGGRIVFASERAPDFHRTRFVSVARVRPQITELAIAPAGAVLAPDRSRYAYGGNGGLVVSSFLGPAPPVVVPTAHPVEDIAWSPDGRAIAFTVSDPSLCLPGYRLCAVYRLFVVPSVGGEARQLADGARFPTWSPNGRWIAFAGEWNTADATFAGASGTPYVVRAGGSGVKRLVRVRGLHALAWAPAGDRLVFSTGNDVVATVRLAGGTRRLGFGRTVSWSPRGVIAFAALAGPIELVRPDGRRVGRNRSATSTSSPGHRTNASSRTSRGRLGSRRRADTSPLCERTDEACAGCSMPTASRPWRSSRGRGTERALSSPRRAP